MHAEKLQKLHLVGRSSVHSRTNRQEVYEFLTGRLTIHCGKELPITTGYD